MIDVGTVLKVAWISLQKMMNTVKSMQSNDPFTPVRGDQFGIEAQQLSAHC